MSATQPAPVTARQYLTFTLAEQAYGIDILNVQEIKGWTVVTPIPNTPRFIKGVMNLRGIIIPVVDLRVKFGLPETAPTRYTVIIVVKVGPRTMGLMVDTVSDVFDVRAEDVQPAPDLGAALNVQFIQGVVCVDDAVITLLDITELLGAALPAPRAPDAPPLP